MIPRTDRGTRYLPAGIHAATWAEVAVRFGTTPHRRALLNGLRRAVVALRAAGCRRLYLDGSFVTGKVRPNDFDACWDTEGVDWTVLEAIAPAILDTAFPRAAQKRAYGGELFPADAAAEPGGTRYLDFFQRDREGRRKGIVAIELEVEL